MRYLRAAIALLITGLFALTTSAADWPTLHHNVARTGQAADSPAPPYRLKWIRVFVEQNIDTGAEAIVAGDHAYITTYAGNVYALERSDGSNAWVYNAAAMILHSPAVSAGVLYVASLRGLHGLEAATGKEKWVVPIKYGFRSSPCVVDGTVYLGSRAGAVYAISAEGEIRWRHDVGSPIYTTLAHHEGTLYLGAEDGRGYALRAKDGERLWRTQSMQASTLRYYYPIVWRDRVVFFTLPTAPDLQLRETGYNMVGREIGGMQRSALSGAWEMPAQPGPPPADKLLEETRVIRKWLDEEPARQSVWVFDRATGKKAFTAPVLFTEGNSGIRRAGAVSNDGWLYTWGGSWWTNWDSNYPYSLERIRLSDGRRELVNYQRFGNSKQHPFGFTFEYNETYNASLGGDRLYIAHSDNAWGLNLSDFNGFIVGGKRDHLGGIYGDIQGTTALLHAGNRWARCTNEWHGTGRGAMSIAGNEVYWVAGGMLQCFVGNGIKPASPTIPAVAKIEQPKRPELLPVIDVPTKLIQAMIEGLPPRQMDSKTGGDVGAMARHDLNAHVKQLLDHWPLQPLLHVAGDDGYGSVWCFAEPRETFTTLSLALPYLDKGIRERVIQTLQMELKNRHPVGVETYAVGEGSPRMAGNSYDVLGEHPTPHRYEPRAANGLYGLWAFVYFSGNQGLAAAHYERAKHAWSEEQGNIQKLLRDKPWERYRKKAPSRATDPQVVQLNQCIAAALGMARLAGTAGDRVNENQAKNVLAKLVRGRVNMPMVDTSYYVPYRAEPAIWYEMIPELAQLLAKLRGSAIKQRYTAEPWPFHRRTVQVFNRNNFWHIAHGEGLIYGETADAWPQGALALFHVRAYAFKDDTAELYRLADMPWCRGDLTYIRKLTMALRASR